MKSLLPLLLVAAALLGCGGTGLPRPALELVEVDHETLFLRIEVDRPLQEDDDCRIWPEGLADASLELLVDGEVRHAWPLDRTDPGCFEDWCYPPVAYRDPDVFEVATAELGLPSDRAIDCTVRIALDEEVGREADPPLEVLPSPALSSIDGTFSVTNDAPDLQVTVDAPEDAEVYVLARFVREWRDEAWYCVEDGCPGVEIRRLERIGHVGRITPGETWTLSRAPLASLWEDWELSDQRWGLYQEGRAWFELAAWSSPMVGLSHTPVALPAIQRLCSDLHPDLLDGSCRASYSNPIDCW